MDDGTTPAPGGYWDPLPTARRLLAENPSSMGPVRSVVLCRGQVAGSQ